MKQDNEIQKNPELSIIVPVYNIKKYLNKCIDSLLQQTLKTIEIILIDDGSTDNSGSICDEYAKRDNRIVVIHQENKGASYARNVGLKMAKGEWVTFVDSDDWVEENLYEIAMKELKENQPDIFIFNYYNNYPKKQLENKNNSFNIAKEVLQIAYEKMKNNVTPKFTKNLSQTINKISNGKYNKVTINDEEGLMVELENGEYITADRLSIGTIDQLYLSLRLSMAEEISEEKMPVILDEAFAYFDDYRLENALKFLVEELEENQIILFTCTKREEEILNRLNIKYNLIEL